MEHTKLGKNIKEILLILTLELDEIRTRIDQSDFNKALDRACAYDEAVEKIKKTTMILEMHEALKEIAKGEGAFSRDHVKHLENCFTHIKSIAEETIAKVEGK